MNLPNGAELTVFATVVIALLEIFNLAMTARAHYVSAKKSRKTVEELKIEVDKKQKSQDEIIEDHEKRLEDMQNGLRATMQGVKALLEHELHNGNADEMKAASNGIDNYLMHR